MRPVRDRKGRGARRGAPRPGGRPDGDVRPVVTAEPRVDPTPARAREVLCIMVAGLDRTPRVAFADPAEVARSEGVAAINRHAPSTLKWASVGRSGTTSHQPQLKDGR